MSLRLRFARTCCSRLIPGLLLALALSSTAFSQQIPCPVTTAYNNSSPTATNSANPCNINATTFTNNAGAMVQNNPGATLDIDEGAAFNNNPGSTFLNQGVLNIAFGFSEGNPGAINGFTTLNVGGTLTNSGTINNQSILNIPLGGVLNNLAGGILQSGNTIVNGTLNSTPTVQLGELLGDGVINANVISTGVAPGDEPGPISMTGLLTINGNYNDIGGDGFFANLGGLTAGTNYDELVVNGTASIDAPLEVVLLPGFTPLAGDTFTLMTFESGSVTFSSVDLPTLPDDENWTVLYGTNDVVLSVRTPEPATLLLLAAGLVTLLGFRRKRGAVIPA